MLLLLILLPLAGALPLLLTRSESETRLGRWSCAVTGLTLLVMVLAVCTRFGESLDIPLCGIRFTLDGFRAIYGLVVSFMWFVSALLTPQYFRGHHHLRRYHFFFLLCLSFTLGVFLSADLYTTFLFFELMSLSSYAWVVQEESPDALDAGKTYLTIAVLGGLVTLMGLFLLYRLTGTLVIADLPGLCAGVTDRSQLWAAALCIFFGFAAKAGVFPLHIWLPDAMEGPTPVSALIHAATMVVAGVYLVARMFPLFIGYAPEVLHWTAYVGAFTAFYAAVVACVQSDIKRVLAFSTISQIGFMLVALGVSTSADPHAGGLGYMASMFHLFTHAMFKALLFLGAGCIIHAVHSNEMSAMGGLRRYMPLTHLTFLVACLAIAGIWPLSGFFSKDEILTACFAFSPVMGWVMTAIAGLTAFYMFRLYYGIFWGAENRELHAAHKPHEAPLTMTLPLVFLAAVTCVAGFIPFGEFVSSDGAPYVIHIDRSVAAVSLCVAAAAIALATWMYARDRQPVADRLAATFSGLHRAAYRRFYIDEVYQFITHRVIFACISTPIAWFDRHVVDGFMNLLAWGANGAAWLIRDMQSGSVQRYCIWFLGGALGLTILILLIC